LNCSKKTLGKDESLGYAVINTQDILQPPHLINNWIKLEGSKSGQIFVAAGFVEVEVSAEEEVGAMLDVEIDEDLAAALKKQQHKIQAEEAMMPSVIQKTGVQTVQIDDDLQAALKKQHKKIESEEEKTQKSVDDPMKDKTDDEEISRSDYFNQNEMNYGKGGAKAVKSILSGTKPADEDFEAP